MPRIAFIGVILAFLAGVGKAEEWRGIRPLRSKITDVERILGKPNENGYYQHKEGRVRVFYGAGSADADTCWGIAAPDVVARISISIEYELNLRDLPLLTSQFERIVSAHLPDSVNYTNWETGIGYGADLETGEVYEIYYYPSRKDCESLLRRKEPRKSLFVTTIQHPHAERG